METPPKKAYQYDDLPAGGYIRTLHLLPGSDNHSLHCTLRTTLMSDAHYEAVSYVWGSDIRDHNIFCDGLSIPITSNLWTVLRHLRSETTRILWADSICIDQDNLKEKGIQVGLMGQIYRSALRVLIVVGDDDLGVGEDVHSLVTEIGTMVRETLQTHGTAEDSFPWPKENAPIVSDPRWGSFNLLLSRDWFRRGWVIQEAALAKESWLIFGKTKLHWVDFILTCTWQMLRFPVPNNLLDRIAMHFTLYTHYNPDVLRAFRPGQVRQSHLSMLAGANLLDFSDPRDRIFAFGEVAKDFSDHVLVQPAYDVSFLLAYRQFAVDYIHHVKSVELLEYAGHMGTSLEEEIPSWVPRWDLKIPSPGFTRALYAAPLASRDGSIYNASVEEQYYLKVRGVLLDTVVYASRLIWKTGQDIVDLSINLLKYLQNLETKTAYPREKLVDVLLENFTSGIFFGPWSRFRRDREAFALHLLQSTGHTDEDDLAQRRISATGGHPEAMVKCISNVISGMAFVLTKQGHMGLVPDVTREGDTCAIIFGCTRLSILRQAGGGGQYRYLGVATIMGSEYYKGDDGGDEFPILGEEGHKEWVDWDVDEQDIVLC
ncbi:heterokaryon incompatibility protein-domain-containing protein [Phaeosphaeria sp. MPI-PUGE-AT-0046c]|nr:heterokaryon incompatibility protein-domain-containing protein [Phaeosphaeria sp. MPI-PUGE-AT-0046c]